VIKFVKRLLIKAHLPLSINRSVCSNYISEHIGTCEVFFFSLAMWYGVIDPLSYSEVHHCQRTVPNIFWLCKWLSLYCDIGFSREWPTSGKLCILQDCHSGYKCLAAISSKHSWWLCPTTISYTVAH